MDVALADLARCAFSQVLGCVTVSSGGVGHSGPRMSRGEMQQIRQGCKRRCWGGGGMQALSRAIKSKLS